MNVLVLHDPEAVAAAAAELVADAIDGGLRTLVLAGGSTPTRAYRLLAGRSLPWGLVTVLFGDERCVPPDDPESNYRMARDELLDRVHPGSVHRMAGELDGRAAAARYDEIVRSLSPLDLVLLGIGPDGHTASLFPGHPALAAGGHAVLVTGAPKPPAERISLTLRALREARRVVVLVTGADKAEALSLAERGAVPAGMIAGAEFVADRAAAALLSSHSLPPRGGGEGKRGQAPPSRTPPLSGTLGAPSAQPSGPEAGVRDLGKTDSNTGRSPGFRHPDALCCLEGEGRVGGRLMSRSRTRPPTRDALESSPPTPTLEGGGSAF